MLKRYRHGLLIILIMFTVGCSVFQFSEKGFIERHSPPDDPKSQTIVLKTEDNRTAILEVHVDYLGNKIEGETQGFRSKCIADGGVAEFWDIVFLNVSRSPIELIEWIYHSGFKLAESKHPDRPITEKMGPEGIQNLFHGQNIIPAKGRLVQKNSFMCSQTETTAEMQKWITLKHEGKTYRLVIRQHYSNH